LSCDGLRVFRGLALGVKEVNEVFDLVRLENVAKSRHGGAAVLDLMLDFFFVEAFADDAEVWT
jgi:hypothetical protein